MPPLVHTTLTTFYHYHCVFKTVLSNIIRHIQNVNSDQVRCSLCRTSEFGVNDNEKTRKKLRRNTKGQDEPPCRRRNFVCDSGDMSQLLLNMMVTVDITF